MKNDKPQQLRCPECRTRRTDRRLMTEHRIWCKRPLCHCMTGATFPHRPGSFKTCTCHPLAGMFLALAYGATDEEAQDIAIEIALSGGGRPAVECPF